MNLVLREIPHGSFATERELVRAVRDGDDRAFEQLFSRYRRRISTYVYGLVRDHGRAEDITQEVFISALRRLRETDTPIALKPWIFEIARNACIDEFRRTSRANVVPLETPRELGAQVPPPPDLASPETDWERKQKLGDLFGAFSELSDNHHRILILRELEGLSYGEIGQRMGMSRPVVESTLFRARRRLHHEYDELASGRRCAEVRTAVDGQEVRALGSLGLRERRRIAHHLEHCHACLRYARAAGVDEDALRVPALGRRVAALLPLGWLRLLGRRHRSAAAGQRVAALTENAAPAVAIGRAAAALVAIAVAGGTLPGIGGGPAPARTAPAARWSPPPGSLAYALEQQARVLPDATVGMTVAVNRLVAVESAAPAAGVPASAPARPATSTGAPAAPAGAAPQPAAPAPAPAAATPAGEGAAPASGTTVAQAAGRAVAPVTSTVPRVAGGVGGAVASLGGAVTGAGGSALSQVSSTVSQVVGAAGSTASQLGAAAGSTVATAGAAAGSVVSQAGAAAGATVSSVTQTAGHTLANTGAAVGQAGAAAGSLTSSLPQPGLP